METETETETQPKPQTFESDIMAYKPAGAVYHVYDIVSTGDDIARFFSVDVRQANGFGQGIGVGAYYNQDAPFGSYAWYFIHSSVAALSRKMEYAYAYTVDMMLNTDGASLHNSGFFVRGSEAMYSGSWAGATGNSGFGGSGIYFNIKYNVYNQSQYIPTHLVMTLKSDVQGRGESMTFTETKYEFPVTVDRVTIADDGDTVYVMVDGELLCTIKIEGTKSYAGIADGTIASTATIRFADGTSETIEDVSCAASFGTLGIGARCADGTQFTWTDVLVETIDSVTIPAFPGSGSETETEDLSDLESHRTEDLAYLNSVTYMNFELTGNKAPYYVGRWFEKVINGRIHTVTTTDGSLLYMMVDGADWVTVNFTFIHGCDMPYFAYSIDGGEMLRNPISNGRIELPDKGRHIICIVADGLYGGENKWVNEAGFAIREITTNGRKVGIKPTAPVVFFYGDSITEGTAALSPTQSGLNNSAVNAYPWFTAAGLGAVPYYVGYSSSGTIATGSFSSCINAIDYLSKDRPLESSSIANITPDLIVINHGVNDIGQNHSISDTITAIKATLTRLQEKYPGVKIIYVAPFWERHNQLAAELGREIDKLVDEFDELYVVRTGDMEISYSDGGHPDTAGAKKIGAFLSEAIRDIVGEDFSA